LNDHHRCSTCSMLCCRRSQKHRQNFVLVPQPIHDYINEVQHQLLTVRAVGSRRACSCLCLCPVLSNNGSPRIAGSRSAACHLGCQAFSSQGSPCCNLLNYVYRGCAGGQLARARPAFGGEAELLQNHAPHIWADSPTAQWRWWFGHLPLGRVQGLV
jgi:hypothetical protein